MLTSFLSPARFVFKHSRYSCSMPTHAVTVRTLSSLDGSNVCSGKTTNVKDAVRVCQNRLEDQGVPEAELSALHMMAHVLQQKTVQGYLKMTDLRLQRVPVPYIIGEWDFRYLTLTLKPPILIPRPETEELVGHVLHELACLTSATDGAVQCLDIGCGSGAISLALLSECAQAHVTAVDIHEAAIDLTRHNARRLNLEARFTLLQCAAASLLDSFPRNTFDVVVSNPPYIPSEDMAGLAKELGYESSHALDGGGDGLDVVRDILSVCGGLLKPSGSLWLEVDSRHPPLIEEFVTQHPELGMEWVATHADLQEKPRFCHLRKA